MKKIEKSLVAFAQFLDKYCPNYFTLIIFLCCFWLAYIIYKHRKKDVDDIKEQKLFDNWFKNPNSCN